MNFIAKYILKYRIVVVCVFTCLAVIAGFLSLSVAINYNMVDYLPDNAQSTTALNVMQQEFDQAIPNGSVMIKNVSVSEAVEYKNKLIDIEGVNAVMWLDDVSDITKPIDLNSESVQTYYKDNNALITITVEEGNETAVLKRIYDVIGENNAVTGDFVDSATQQTVAAKESARAMLVLVPVIILILLIATTSYIEPILFLITIGISVLINAGTNFFLGEISFITQAISPILQMAVSLDYAIFLLHSFDDYRKETTDVFDAMKKAMKRAFPAIAASAATTLFGFVALLFMHFEIGSDLGINLVKGIILSFVSVLVFLPALTILCYKLIDKTRHKRILPEFKGIGKGILKTRFVAVILVALLIVPAFIAQSNNNFFYGFGSNTSPESRSGKDAVAIKEVFGTSTPIVLLVPKGDFEKEKELGNKLKNIDHVTEVASMETVVSSLSSLFMSGKLPDGTELPSGKLPDGVSEDMLTSGKLPDGVSEDMLTSGKLPDGTELPSGKLPDGVTEDMLSGGKLPSGKLPDGVTEDMLTSGKLPDGVSEDMLTSGKLTPDFKIPTTEEIIKLMPNEIVKQFYSENYARFIVKTDTEFEGDVAFDTVQNVQNTASEYYGDKVLSCGNSVNLFDMKNIIERDTMVVNLIAIISIALVILITFKSISLPVLLVLTIETSIWMNLATPFILGQSLCYIGFLVISTVQLGATVDYAILLTDHYMKNRQLMGKRDAIVSALGETSKSIFVSGSILASAGLCLGIVSSNQIVSQLGFLLFRGTLLSMLMVLFFLPAMLYFCDKIIPYTTIKARFFKKSEK